MNSPDVAVDNQSARHAAVPSKRYRTSSLKIQRRPVALRNWSVPQRLITVIVIALVLGVVFGAQRIASAATSETVFARTTQLAVLGEQDAALAQALENERDLTAALCAASPGTVCPVPGTKLDRRASALRAKLVRAQAATNPLAIEVHSASNQIGGAFPASTQLQAAQVLSMTGLISAIRVEVGSQTPTSAITAYSEAISDLFSLNDEITSSSGDALLSDEVRTLGSLSRSKDQVSQERAIFESALLAGSFGGGQQALTTAQGLDEADLSAFQTSDTTAEENDYLSELGGEKVDTTALTDSILSVFVTNPSFSPFNAYNSAIENGKQGAPGVSQSVQPSLWYTSMSDTIDRTRNVEARIAASVVARSQSLEHGAFVSEVLTASVTGLLLLIVLVLTIVVARSLVDPLRRLQAEALEIASVRLPARVAELSEATDSNVSLEVEPISVQSTDEIGRVARAFDQVHREAVRLAGNEALLRGNLNAMFISLSRRSVPLIERLSRVIDYLEQNEDDPDRLSNLFSMDHLVTRMRRNSENLLVLAGEEPVRKWSKPVPLTDVARAAMSEIEQYGRVVLNVQPDIVVSGQAATDIVHLLAEVIENATMFSPPETSVHLSGQELSSGGVLLEVRDGGIGVSPTRIEEMNWRLENVPVIDVSVSRHMGLFAVSRLASRHGIRIRLRAASPQGLSALIWLPGSLTERETVPYGGRQSRELAGEATMAQLRVGGRHAGARRNLREEEDVYAGNGNGRRESAGNGYPRRESVGAGATWFGAKRPSGASARGASAHAAGIQAASMQAAETQATSTQSVGGFAPADISAPEPLDSRPWAFGGTVPAAGTASTTGTTGTWGGGDWDVAEPESPPVQGNLTASGLPTRVPRTNLPGSAAGRTAPHRSPTEAFSAPTSMPRYDTQPAPSRQPTPLPRRSPEHARNRMRGFQLGSRDGEEQTPRAGEESSR
jgi:signal transduction histidine kinase